MPLARAESLLAAGDLALARHVAESLLVALPDDPRALTILGRIYLVWPVVGRFTAESLLTRAGELDPGNPEPFYYLGKVGIALRGDDGEAIARRGLQQALELDPLYRDVWALWARLYRGDRERRSGVTALLRHTGEPAPDLWRARLLIELEDYASAETLLAVLSVRDPRDPAPRALRAQALFEDGRDSAASLVYDEALASAGADTGGVLWLQVRGIATPGEREDWSRAAPEARTALLRRFWAYRDPLLSTSPNERIGEHFRRLRETRRLYALLHPNSLYHHSRTWRALVDGPAPSRGPGLGELAAVVRSDLPPRPADGLLSSAVPVFEDEGDESPNLEDGLDDRGRVYLRHGPPDERRVWSLDGETWRYRLGAGTLQVTFARRTNGWGTGGDVVVTPFVDGEAAAGRYLLATDRAADAATLDVAFWPVAFRGPSRWTTDLTLFPDAPEVLAVLFDADGRVLARDSAAGGPLHLTAAPGEYRLALDAADGDRRGRFRGWIALPPFTGERLSISGLLVASAPVVPSRPAMEAAAPADLRLPAGTPFRVYAELYGVALGTAHLEVAYAFERRDRGGLRGLLGRGGRRTTIAFRREPSPERVIVESVVVDPGRLPAGRYRLRLDVRDVTTGAHASSPSIEFELR